jgi:glycosyltransferase involved in cell wall biosynthesis
MVTIALTNRNRDLRIIKNSLDSLADQTVKDFKVILVDYGSEESFVNLLIELVKKYSFIQLITCPVQGQLWNKCRAINIALKQTTTSYLVMGDIDMIYRKDFVEKVILLSNNNAITYFKVGFLSKEESGKNRCFNQHVVKHYSSSEATGITLYPNHLLKNINGYDEFYHGWGAEDTDVHIRLKNAGYNIDFYHEEIILYHQWHPKVYRSKESMNPFHSKLERINHSYMQLTENYKRIKANLNTDWGKVPSVSECKKLFNNPDYNIDIDSSHVKVSALLAQLQNFETELVKICIKEVALKEKWKQILKKCLGKKSQIFWSMEAINNRILEEIIVHYRNLPYRYTFERQKGEIQLLIQFEG